MNPSNFLSSTYYVSVFGNSITECMVWVVQSREQTRSSRTGRHQTSAGVHLDLVQRSTHSHRDQCLSSHSSPRWAPHWKPYVHLLLFLVRKQGSGFCFKEQNWLKKKRNNLVRSETLKAKSQRAQVLIWKEKRTTDIKRNFYLVLRLVSRWVPNASCNHLWTFFRDGWI